MLITKKHIEKTKIKNLEIISIFNNKGQKDGIEIIYKNGEIFKKIKYEKGYEVNEIKNKN